MVTMEAEAGPYRYDEVGSQRPFDVFVRLGTEGPDMLAVAGVIGGAR